MNLAADESAGGNYSRLVTELDQMADKGINHLRIMAASEGAPTPQPFRMNPALMQAPGEYNENIFKGLDICLDEMAKRGMRATMTLNNEWQWSGGFAQYVSWAQNNSEIPYPVRYAALLHSTVRTNQIVFLESLRAATARSPWHRMGRLYKRRNQCCAVPEIYGFRESDIQQRASGRMVQGSYKDCHESTKHG
jgi:hypothetical protein